MTDKRQLSHEIVLLCEHIDIAQFISVYIDYLRKQQVEIPAVKIINIGDINKIEQILQQLTRQSWFMNIFCFPVKQLPVGGSLDFWRMCF